MMVAFDECARPRSCHTPTIWCGNNFTAICHRIHHNLCLLFVIVKLLLVKWGHFQFDVKHDNVNSEAAERRSTRRRKSCEKCKKKIALNQWYIAINCISYGAGRHIFLSYCGWMASEKYIVSESKAKPKHQNTSIKLVSRSVNGTYI